MSIHDRCWQCRYGEKTEGQKLRCNLIDAANFVLDCDDQRQSGSKKDCGPEARFFVHRDLHKIKELADA